MKRPRNVEARAAWLPLTLAACAAGAQVDDVPLPPRLDPEPAAAPGRSDEPVRAPDRTRLAPPAEARDAARDEIVVLGETQWRLPDLGSDWRAEQQAQEDAARIQASFLPLYDPGAPATRSDVFLLDREAHRRHGVIELFRIRFGRRARD